jgi:nitrogen-specific signal transduction histidine kinase
MEIKMTKGERDFVHDIRNSLGGIMGYAALLEQDLKDKPDLQKMANRIVKSVNNLNELLTVMMEEQKNKE